MISRTRIAACFVVLAGAGAVTACASVIGIGDPSLDTDEGGTTLPAEASLPEAAPVDAAPEDSRADGAQPVPDAGPQLACGAAKCPLATSVCCSYHQTQGSPEHKLECSATCRPPDAMSNGLIALKCGRPSDCPQGKRCCLRLSTLVQGTSACEDSCSGAYTMCNPGGGSGGSGCSSGRCRTFQTALPSDYAYCD